MWKKTSEGLYKRESTQSKYIKQKTRNKMVLCSFSRRITTMRR